MRVPVAWLRSYCDSGAPTREIAEKLSMSGLELERIESLGVPDTAGFVVGKVVAAEPHPDADRLTVCRVDTGDGERTIVCGAPNVAAGQTVGVALPGAVMPDGSKLGRAKLRGVESDGMILAEDEVGMGEGHVGTMELSGDLPVGVPLGEFLTISDEALEIEVNPNRPDCMSVYGVAREVHALTGAPLAEDPGADDVDATGDGNVDDLVRIDVDPEVCLRFTARGFDNVTVGPSPEWLKQRLTAAGQRPISNVVDITNYVMLAIGQPLHAFDLDKVRGGRIDVRSASPGERITTLDGAERELDERVAVVSDGEGPSGIAGIMGGQISEVSESTTRVLMEAATWVGPNILAASKRLGLRSEAGARFERQLHPDGAMAGQRLAARLMVELCGARLVPGTIDVYPRPAGAVEVTLRLERLERLLGVPVESDEAVAILERLGYGVETGDGVLDARVPGWRQTDTTREADLIEEVVRIAGLDRLPATLPARRAAVGGLTRAQRLRRRAVDALVDRGLSEVVSYSFTSRESLTRLRLDPDDPVVAIANPMTEDQAVMRPTLLGGLLDALAHNATHGAAQVGLLECAAVYAPGSDGADRTEDESPAGARPASEQLHIGALTTRAVPASWRTDARAADFHSAKGLLDVVLRTYGIEAGMTADGQPTFLNRSRSATVVGGDSPLGWVGELHPLVVRAWGLGEVTVAGFEIDVDALADLGADAPEQYQPVSAFPPVREDIAVVAPVEVSAAAIEQALRAAGGDLLSGVGLFDLFAGDQVGAGNRSLAFSLEFSAPDRTLTTDEVAERRSAIEAELAKIGGRIRG